MSTSDVPGKRESNRDELHAGCWAEHDKEEPPQDVPIVALADVPAVSAGEMAPPILIDEQGVRVADLVS